MIDVILILAIVYFPLVSMVSQVVDSIWEVFHVRSRRVNIRTDPPGSDLAGRPRYAAVLYKNGEYVCSIF